MGKTATPSKQRDGLKTYLRTLRANANRARKERRTRFPLEDSLRWRRYQEANDLVMLAEACLSDLAKAAAINVAPVRPGDQIIATLTVKGYRKKRRRTESGAKQLTNAISLNRR